jgi:hypothetical protein
MKRVFIPVKQQRNILNDSLKSGSPKGLQSNRSDLVSKSMQISFKGGQNILDDSNTISQSQKATDNNTSTIVTHQMFR